MSRLRISPEVVCHETSPSGAFMFSKFFFAGRAVVTVEHNRVALAGNFYSQVRFI